MNNDDDLHDRLEKIEGQLNQIRIFLAILIVIVLIGLPGVVNRTAELGFAGVFFVLPILVGGYVVFYLLDLFFLRSSRKERERMMERRMQEEVIKFKSEHAGAQEGESAAASSPPVT